jgi:hypothetical protein
MKHHFGIIGLVVGLIAIGVAIFQDDLRAYEVQLEPAVEAKPELTLKELAIEAGRKVIEDKILKEDAESPVVVAEPPPAARDKIELIYMVLGFFAMVLGVVSWAKKDHIRISGGAISLGLMAVAWQYVLIGIVIAVVILVLSNISA